jgi:NAD(P)-dependent dehydrogenase (short-subunit alcohol dehydrogenase family)
MTLTDRAALVTGGRRIGQAVARELAARGCDVALAYRGSKDVAEQTAADVRSAGRRAAIIQADVSKAADVDRLMQGTVEALGRLDVLVHMASVYVSKPFDELTEADWDRDLTINLKSAFLCARAAVPHMRKAGGGRIVHFADWLARSGRPSYRGFVPYYVAKAGTIALTEALALELARDQILVNAIAPGPIVPPPEMDPAEVREVADATPVGRWGGALEIARAVVALVESDFITGETVRVDGGRHVR